MAKENTLLTIGNAYTKESIPRQVIGLKYEVSELCMSAGGVKGPPRLKDQKLVGGYNETF